MEKNIDYFNDLIEQAIELGKIPNALEVDKHFATLSIADKTAALSTSTVLAHREGEVISIVIRVVNSREIIFQMYFYPLDM